MKLRRLVMIFLIVMLTGGAARGSNEPADAHNMAVSEQLTLDEWRPMGPSEIAFAAEMLIIPTFPRLPNEDPQGGPVDLESRTGFSVVRLDDRSSKLEQLAFFRCPNWADAVVWKHWVFVGVWQRGGGAHDPNNVESSSCNNTNASTGEDGVRIVDISEPRHPRQVGFINTRCAVGPLTLLPTEKQVLIYNGTPCHETVYNPVANGITAGMEIYAFDPKKPEQSRIVSRPRLVNQDSGVVVPGCQDITVFPARELATCTFFDSFVMLDISDPVNPRIAGSPTRVPGAEYFRMANFTWDGEYIVLGDAANVRGPFAAAEPTTCEQGAARVWIFNVEDPEHPVETATWQPDRSVAKRNNQAACAPYTVQVLPYRNQRRYRALIGYSGFGASMIDFTDPTKPIEVAHYQPKSTHTFGAYWYRGRIFMTDLAGPDVRALRLAPKLRKGLLGFRNRLNVQTQLRQFTDRRSGRAYLHTAD